MLKLKDKTIEPQGGWVYRDTDLNIRIRAGTFNNLVQSVRNIRKLNSLPIPENIVELIEHSVCLNTAKAFVANPNASYLGMVTSSEMDKAVTNIPRTMVTTFDAIVIGEERKAICRNCPHNIPTVCISCGGWDTLYQSRFPNLTLCSDKFIHTCQIDCLPGLVSIYADHDRLEKHLAPRTPYPETCWKKRSPT